MSVDVISYLDSLDIDYKSHGTNVGPNDVNIDCPWCFAEKHLGIHRSQGITNCWVCGKQTSMVALIQILERIPWHRAKEKYKEIGGDDPEDISRPEELFERPEECWLPDEAFSFDDPQGWEYQRDHAYSYLKHRGYTVKTIRARRIKFCPTGQFAHRLIIPVYLDRKMVNWIGRRYLRAAGARYKNCPVEGCVVRMRDTFFGLDEFKASGSRALRLVEGYFDKERIGDTAMAVFRSQVSRKQRSILIQLRLRQLSVIFDPDPGAQGRALAIAEAASAVVPVVKSVRLPAGKDPADMDPEDLFEIEAATPPLVL